MGLEDVPEVVACEVSDLLGVLLVELVDADDSVHSPSSGMLG